MLPKIIVFTGIDGSGKTTQAQLLVEHLQKKDIVVIFVQQFAPNKITKAILKKTAPTLKKLERNASNKPYFNQKNLTYQPFLKSLLRRCALTRIICTGLIHTWPMILLNIFSSIIVFDRYFYDNLIKAKWMYGISDRLEGILIRLVPKPFILFYLDIPPEKAWNREKEGDTTLEQHRIKKEIYDEWFERMKKEYKNFYRVNTEREEKKTHFEIISILKRR
jgi:dTMP kinase